jgi:beta-galactosidase
VDFTLEGPGAWRGGYNSGKTGSINHPWLDLEAGINRVAVRAGRTPGTITLRATAAGLTAAVATVESQPSGEAGALDAPPPAQAVELLPDLPPTWVDFPNDSMLGSGPVTAKMAGRFVKNFNYSGPSSYIVHVESFARPGRNAYVDADSPLPDLPAGLDGADWVQAAQREALYHAVDLMQIEVTASASINIAHDDRLPRPPWLTALFRPTGQSLKVLGHPMSVFTRRIASAESVTLGPNTEESTVDAANMYVVFVSVSSTGR